MMCRRSCKWHFEVFFFDKRKEILSQPKAKVFCQKIYKRFIPIYRKISAANRPINLQLFVHPSFTPPTTTSLLNRECNKNTKQFVHYTHTHIQWSPKPVTKVSKMNFVCTVWRYRRKWVKSIYHRRRANRNIHLLLRNFNHIPIPLCFVFFSVFLAQKNWKIQEKIDWLISRKLQFVENDALEGELATLPHNNLLLKKWINKKKYHNLSDGFTWSIDLFLLKKWVELFIWYIKKQQSAFVTRNFCTM